MVWFGWLWGGSLVLRRHTFLVFCCIFFFSRRLLNWIRFCRKPCRMICRASLLQVREGQKVSSGVATSEGTRGWAGGWMVLFTGANQRQFHSRSSSPSLWVRMISLSLCLSVTLSLVTVQSTSRLHQICDAVRFSVVLIRTSSSPLLECVGLACLVSYWLCGVGDVGVGVVVSVGVFFPHTEVG